MEVISVLLVGSIVTFFMYRNINKITENLALEKNGTFEEYAAFASAVSETIRNVKNDLDRDIGRSHPIFIAKETCDTDRAVKELLDLLRATSFYETVMARRKTPKEVEAAMAETLTKLDAIIRRCCQDGDRLADELKERLHEEYQKIGA